MAGVYRGGLGGWPRVQPVSEIGLDALHVMTVNGRSPQTGSLQAIMLVLPAKVHDAQAGIRPMARLRMRP